MEAGPIKLLKLLGEHKSTFNIPVYQRNYEWTKDQVKQYFRDVEAILEEIEPRKLNIKIGSFGG